LPLQGNSPSARKLLLGAIAQHLVRRQNYRTIAPEIFPFGSPACGQETEQEQKTSKKGCLQIV